MICIVGDLGDLSARYVGWLAERRGVPVQLLAEDMLGVSWWFRLAPDGGGALVIGDREIDLRQVDGALVRLHPEPAVSEVLAITPEAEPLYALERRHGLHWFLNEAPFRVVNRPCSGRSNGSKPYQMALLSESGFDVPEWILTTEARAAREFLGRWPEGSVYKAASGLRSHVRAVDDELIDRLTAGTTPVIIQRYIPGVDVRVHTIGGTAFATEVASKAIDYRFDVDEPAYRSVEVSSALMASCLATAAQEGLDLAGFDFRRDSTGRWWCLEMNPVPTFLPYEAATGHPIGDAIVDHLLGTATGTTTSPLTSALAAAEPAPV